MRTEINHLAGQRSSCTRAVRGPRAAVVDAVNRARRGRFTDRDTERLLPGRARNRCAETGPRPADKSTTMGKTDIKVKIKKRATASTQTRLDRVEVQRPQPRRDIQHEAMWFRP